jgi:glycosyltransferase involved in cell wall biosynthesis
MVKREGLIDLANVSDADILKNYECIVEGNRYKITRPQTILWFLPIVTHALKGGVRTVFEFSEYLSQKYNTQTIFVVYSFNGSDFDLQPLSRSIREYFPNLRFILRKFIRGIDSEKDLPPSEAAFCTLWTTAFLLLRYNNTKRKFYFMQDYEPMFYAGGDLYMIIEQTYRFGFSAIANTPGVGTKYLQYSDDIVSFLPGIDRTIFYPGTYEGRVDKGVEQIVFYGRPENSRNAFFLGIDILKSVKAQMKDKVRIVSAGAVWSPAEFGIEGVVENVGLLGKMDEVADLYRQSSIGLVFMATPHPSYQPLEYMACGCIVTTNINEANSWLLSEKNALLVEPLAQVAANKIVKLLGDPERRHKLVQEAYRTVEVLQWERAYQVIEERLLA